ncbi:MAG: KAP family NTPase [Burkholderiales bacterium]|nr:KAP family NTPase [Burkholderiales bacterium]
MSDDTKDMSFSESNAKNIYDTLLVKNESKKYENEIISIIGSWGSGKSSVKNILHEDYCSEKTHTITSTYNALQFEEKSQVTAELYNVIAQSLPKSLLLGKNKFKAIAQLKKESFSQSISTSQVWSIFIIGIMAFLITKLSKLPELNNLFTHLPGVIPVLNPALGNKLIIGFLGLLGIFYFRDKLLFFIAGLLPRKSHVNILESINLGGNELILIIDEIDRLNPESTKLLFDEVLIIKTSLEKAKVNFKILLFYDEDVIFHNFKLINIYEPHIFLQKFYDRQFRLPRVVFSDDLLTWVALHNHLIFKRNLPTRKIIHHIANNISSFREYDRIIDYFNDQIARYISDDVIRFNQIDMDVFFFSLSLRFFFDLKGTTELFSNGLYSKYFNDGINILHDIYTKTHEELHSIISNDLSELSNTGLHNLNIKPSAIYGIVLNPDITTLEKYCQNINKNIELFNWTNISYAFENIDIIKNYFEIKDFNLFHLICTLSELFNSRINNKDYAAHVTTMVEGHTIAHIKDLYLVRIECIRFFLFIYIKLGNPIGEFFLNNPQGKIDNLVICAIFRFKRILQLSDESVVVHTIIRFAGARSRFETDLQNNIRDLFNGLHDIVSLLNDDMYLYQACDLIIKLLGITNNQIKVDGLSTMNTLVYISIFQNNPLEIQFHNCFLKSISERKFTSEISQTMIVAVTEGINTTNRESYTYGFSN